MGHDDTDFGRKTDVPMLVLWGSRGTVGRQFDCLAAWREVARHVSGRALECGHFAAEEAPAETLAEISAFLARHTPATALSTTSKRRPR